MTIQLSPYQWDETGPEDDPSLRLRTSTDLAVDGKFAKTDLHLEAIRVRIDKDGMQVINPRGTNLDNPEVCRIEIELDELYSLSGTGSPFETTEINGFDYVIFAYPFGT
jgi:hypothetical protein